MSTKFNMELPDQDRSKDHLLIASVFLLVGMGLVALYSASYAFSQRRFDNGLYLLKQQALLGGAGIVLFFLASLINLEILRKFVKPLVLLSMILCVLPFISFFAARQNAETNTARWIGIGAYTFQPSELVKLTIPLYLAHIFDKKKENINNLFRGLIPPTLICGVFFVLIIMQNNFSTAVFLAFNTLFIFFLAGVKFRYFFSAFLLIIPTAALLILNREHRLMRILSWLMRILNGFINHVGNDYQPQGAGYQVRASILAINSGGFWGKGIGQGTRKIISVPEIHSDFIFASYAEELGFLGVLLFCLLFGVFAVRGYHGSMKNENSFNRLLGCGLVTMIISQVLLNIAVVTGVLPVTGVPLPFFSHGGSSLVITLIMAGLVVNVSRVSKSSGREY